MADEEQENRVADGYEIYRPNREKEESVRTKFLTALLFVVIGVLILLISIGGWTRLEGVKIVSVAFALAFFGAAFFVYRWQRGLLPMAMSLGVLTVIFGALAAPTWFERDKPGLTPPPLPDPLVGTLVVILIPIVAITIAVSMVAFNQKWHVEEERPIPGHEAHRPDRDDDRGHGSGPEIGPAPGGFTPGSPSTGM